MEEILIIAFCLLVNALLSAFEMAFVSISRGELKRAAKAGSKDAERLLRRREHPERTLSIIQIGITLVGALAAAVGGVGAAESIQPFFMQEWGMREVTAEILSVIIIVLPLTYLSVVIGELTPKSLALRAPLSIVLRGARWIAIADRVLAPAVSLLEWSTKKMLKLFFWRSRPAAASSQETTVDLDSLSPGHQQAVLNLVHIENRKVKDILVPWKDVTHVRVTDTMEDVVPIVFASGHTRLPVTDNGDVAGVLHTKEFLAFRENGGQEWQSNIRPVIRVKSADTALSVLRLMQSQRSHMAVVFSLSGERLGIVTMEDILEEFLGDIFDEDENSRIRKVFAERVKSKGLPGSTLRD